MFGSAPAVILIFSHCLEALWYGMFKVLKWHDIKKLCQSLSNGLVPHIKNDSDLEVV